MRPSPPASADRFSQSIEQRFEIPCSGMAPSGLEILFGGTRGAFRATNPATLIS
jgi:hypothetical protein